VLSRWAVVNNDPDVTSYVADSVRHADGRAVALPLERARATRRPERRTAGLTGRGPDRTTEVPVPPVDLTAVFFPFRNVARRGFIRRIWLEPVAVGHGLEAVFTAPCPLFGTRSLPLVDNGPTGLGSGSERRLAGPAWGHAPCPGNAGPVSTWPAQNPIRCFAPRLQGPKAADALGPCRPLSFESDAEQAAFAHCRLRRSALV